MLGTVNLVLKDVPASSLFPLPEDVVEWPLVLALAFHFLVTLPGLLLNLGGVAFWYFSIASATGMTSFEADGPALILNRSSRWNLNGFVLR